VLGLPQSAVAIKGGRAMARRHGEEFMGKSISSHFRVKPGKGFKLSDIDPRDTGPFSDKDEAKTQIEKDAAAIDELQNRLYAEGSRALLVVLQGIDCAGKDGTVRAVFNTCGPIGVVVNSFKGPTAPELAHDYLWRVHQAVPSRGLIGIFNRSHYEDVLVAKVRGLAPPEALERRYEEINGFEKLLDANGTRILKFMLHISKDEQAERLRDRVADPAKRWKFNPGDLADRALWDKYQQAYEIALNRCSSVHAPWHVIPADRNWVRNAAIAAVVRETLEEMNPQYPAAKGWDPAAVKIE
jgi:PPK2 family polyphosphate:nucleotide phosphotransferase